MQFMNLKKGQLKEYINKEKDDSALWLFHHIPKTAGSSLVVELSANRPPYINICIDYSPNISLSYEEKMQNVVESFLEEKTKSKVRSASGHLSVSHFDTIMSQCKRAKAFTYMRHPIKRIISEYNYSCSTAHPSYQIFKEKYPTFEDYINDASSVNKHAFYMFGSKDLSPDDAIWQMTQKYHFIGLQDYYSKSFIILSNMLWEGSLPKAKERVAQNTSNKNTVLSEEVMDKIIRDNALDMALFTAVSRVYERISDDIRSLEQASFPIII